MTETARRGSRTIYLLQSHVFVEPDSEFASGIQLRHATLDATIGPGQPLPVSLQWPISERQRTRYTVFVHLYETRQANSSSIRLIANP